MIKPLLCILVLAVSQLSAELKPAQIAVLYNSNTPESKELAHYYAEARHIPIANLVGIPVSDKETLNRSQYNQSLRDPLRKIFTERNWWTMGPEVNGDKRPTACKISAIVCMRGIPFKVSRTQLLPEEKAAGKKALATEAAVDSELALLGVHEISLNGPIPNPYYQKGSSFDEQNISSMILVGRIDGPDYKICKRMIDDAISTEKRGLWGVCYLDYSLKGGGYKRGDQWLETIAALNHSKGIPTAIDRNKQTFTTNYPMENCSIYFGWYTKHRNGPLLNPAFLFRKGAIATHLHSFSAQNLRSQTKNWSGAILAHGAAATLGNVYEPYLGMVHHYDIFYDRLMKGHTFIEAAYMAAPSLSWQNVALGDPLYRPFLHIRGSGERNPKDKDYRAIRLANSIWSKEPKTLIKKLTLAAETKNKGVIYEYLGLWHRYENKNDDAICKYK